MTLYIKQITKRKGLIRKLFEEIAVETVGIKNLKRVKLLILTRYGRGTSYCGTRYNKEGEEYIRVCLNLRALEIRIREGYGLPNYYNTRPDRINKYVKKNRHNALRFVLYHETRHAYQRINNINRDNSYTKEYDADTWAIKQLEARV